MLQSTMNLTPQNQSLAEAAGRLPKAAKVCLIILVILFCVFGYINIPKRFSGLTQAIDFSNYYIAAFAAKDMDIQNVYDVENALGAAVSLHQKALDSDQKLLLRTSAYWARGLPKTPTTYHFNASPFLYAALSVFEFDNYQISLWVSCLFSLFCYAFAIFWLGRRRGYSFFCGSYFPSFTNIMVRSV